MKKISKAKNLSAGPSKKTVKAGPVDPKGNWTKVQERTLGNMKKGGVIKKAQNGLEEVPPGRKYIPSKNPEENRRAEESIKKAVKEYELRRSKIGNIPDGKKTIPIGKKKMKSGGSLKPVDKTAKPGLAKLPTAVRNKMGYQKMGGKTSKKK